MARPLVSTSPPEVGPVETAAASYDGSLSLPLYVSGLVGSLAALAAINTALGVDTLSAASSLLAILGFTFSYACRWSGIKAKPVDCAALFLTGFLVLRVAAGDIDIGAILPVTKAQGDLQMAVILEWLSVIFAWTLLDDRKVVMSSILSIAMIGLVAAYDLNVELVFYFLIYVLATVFLLIHQNFLLHRTWGADGSASTLPWRLLGAQLIVAAACSTVVMLCALVLVTPIQEIGSHLSLASAMRGLVGLDHPDADPTPLADGFSDDPAFPIGQGSSTAPSTQVVMRVYPSDGQEHYWRGRTYDKYTIKGWVSTEASEQTDLGMPSPGDMSDYLPLVFLVPALDADAGPTKIKAKRLTTRFEVIAGETDTLYTPSCPVEIDVGEDFRDRLIASEDGQIELGEPMTDFDYGVVSNDYEPSILQLQRVYPTDVPPPIRTTCIDQRGDDVSASDSARLAQTAAAIVATLPPNRRDEYDEAEQIHKWIDTRVEYSDIVPPIPDGQDPVSYFLFTSKVGYCDMFATSMAILCRYAGLPSRVVTGFLPGDRRPDGFHVRLMDKHAWCEVYFPKYGWVDFDPTSGSVLAPATQASSDDMKSAWRDYLSRIRMFVLTNGPFPFVVLLIAALAIGFLFKTEVFDRFFRRGVVLQSRLSGDLSGMEDREAYEIARSSARDRWKAVRDELARWRLRQHPAETTREFVDRVVSTMCAVDQYGRDHGAATGSTDLQEAIRALSSLADAFLAALYSDDDDPVISLIARERDGLAVAEGRVVLAYLAWGRKYASKIPLDRQVDVTAGEESKRDRDALHTPAGVR